MHDTKFSGRKFIFFDQICFFFIKSAWLAAAVIADKAVLPAERGISAQLGRIRKEVRSLDFMPARYTLVEWEPWHSMKMHQLPVDNFIVYYLVDDKERTVLLLGK